ncbi:MAG: hypothetical protein ACP5N1_03930 [Candidatus Woesearchaeota archaeon]
MFNSMRESINNIINRYSWNSKNTQTKTHYEYRCVPAPEYKDGTSSNDGRFQEIQKYNLLTGETISGKNKVYALVFPENYNLIVE